MHKVRSILVLLLLTLVHGGVAHAQWLQTNGPHGEYIECFAVSGTNLFAGTYGGGVWRLPLSEIVTGVEDVKGGMPNIFSLEQNYPNPFNPTTVIEYSIQNGGMVRLTVYDILGQEIVTLVNNAQTPGLYEVEFNAQNLTSGIYFYRLTVGSLSEAKKLMFLK